MVNISMLGNGAKFSYTHLISIRQISLIENNLNLKNGSLKYLFL